MIADMALSSKTIMCRLKVSEKQLPCTKRITFRWYLLGASP